MPRRFDSPFVAYVIGPPEFERYVIKDNRIDFPRYIAGMDDEGWTEDLRKALVYARIDDLSPDIQEITKRELGHLPQRTYRLDVEVTVIGEATPEQVRQYIHEALTINLDYQGHGPGPTVGSYVMVKTNAEGLRPGDESGSG